MPTVGQIVPLHEYAHVMTQINDNSARPSITESVANETYCNMIFAFTSPKGIDREMHTVATGKDEFTDTYGLGPHSIYGQAFLNAYNAACTNNATLHCLRVTADDATYAMGALVAHYRVTGGGDTPVGPELTKSDLIDDCGHADITAVDSKDQNGNVVITLSGTDVASGISEANAELFGEVGENVVDLTLKFKNLEDDKTYQVKQTNELLAIYYGKDEYITQIDGKYVKTKNYTGASLKEGYTFLVASNMTLDIEMTEVTSAPATCDLGILLADSKARVDAVKSGTTYTVTRSGEAVAGILHPALFGNVSNLMEMVFTIPDINTEKTYTIQQINPALAGFSGDPTISNSPNQGWTKVKTYNGTDILDGFAIVTDSTNSPIAVKVFENTPDTETDVETDVPFAIINIDSSFTFVTAHAPAVTPEAAAYKVMSQFTFAGEKVAISYKLKAMAAQSKANRSVFTGTKAPSNERQMEIYYTFEAAPKAPTSLENMENAITIDATPDANGYVAVKMFDIACRGRGSWGNNVRFVLKNYSRGDRLSDYKNYIIEVYEIEKGTLYKREEFTIAFTRDASNSSGDTLFADYIIGDPYQSSNYVTLRTNVPGFETLFAAYADLFPDTTYTVETFDPILGFQKGNTSKYIEGLSIDTTSTGTLSVSGASGVGLVGGSDGKFTEGYVGREEAINEALLKAYSGEIDRNIRSKKLYPADLILDAGFTVPIKLAIAKLVEERKDCIGIFDLGTDFNSYAGLLEELGDLEVYINDRAEAIDAYYGKIKDPVSYQLTKVTSTYQLASAYPNLFAQNGGKHVPLAGSAYAVLSDFISGSAYPVYDDDLDSDVLDELTDLHVNFLKVNTSKQIVRGSQSTRQEISTNLSELSNMFVLNDIKRDCEMLCEQYEYNFSEESDLQRFNKAADIIASKYSDAQVKSIEARFDQNVWESERGILHLYVYMIHKDIIKISIVEIDVNRA